jgi:hypothetical protein
MGCLRKSRLINKLCLQWALDSFETPNGGQEKGRHAHFVETERFIEEVSGMSWKPRCFQSQLLRK